MEQEYDRNWLGRALADALIAFVFVACVCAFCWWVGLLHADEDQPVKTHHRVEMGWIVPAAAQERQPFYPMPCRVVWRGGPPGTAQIMAGIPSACR